MGVGLAGTGMVYSRQAQREKEKELLFIGGQYRKAIMLYYESSPGIAKKYPATLQELLKDDRYPGVRRYLRKLYRDPMTNGTDWGIVRAPDRGVMGVYSPSEQSTLKISNFRDADKDLEGKTRYSDWKFFYSPSPQMAPQPAPAKDLAK